MDTNEYLSKFGDVAKLPREILLKEIDSVWRGLSIDNTKSLSTQSDAVGEFYSHPVWALNGVFSELDPVSESHRIAITRQVESLGAKVIADYGGGSGVLARFISALPGTQVDIIEPYPSEYFVAKFSNTGNINLIPNLLTNYDVVIAQDVLEHVDDPVSLALDMVSATKMNGHLIFANCFYPDISCHLPTTFYLRHTFPIVMTYAGLKLVGRVHGAEHALVFRRFEPIKYDQIKGATARAKIFGPILNRVYSAARGAKRVVKSVI